MEHRNARYTWYRLAFATSNGLTHFEKYSAFMRSLEVRRQERGFSRLRQSRVGEDEDLRDPGPCEHPPWVMLRSSKPVAVRPRCGMRVTPPCPPLSCHGGACADSTICTGVRRTAISLAEAGVELRTTRARPCKVTVSAAEKCQKEY